MSTPIRLTVVMTHPIQYYSPWFRFIASAVRELELSHGPARRRATLALGRTANQLQPRARAQCRTIHVDECSAITLGLAVNCARDCFLPSPGGAREKKGVIGSSKPLYRLAQSA